MRVRIQPYSIASRSARALSMALGILRLRKPSRSRFRAREGDLIINWGDSSTVNITQNYVNHPLAVLAASSKLNSMVVFAAKDVNHPAYTTFKAAATGWLDEGEKVVCRHLLRANSGRGIELHIPGESTGLPDCPLYTKYIDKDAEYRVHVWGDKAFDFQEKKRRNGCRETANPYIRNHANDWVFTRNDLVAPLSVSKEAIKAVRALGLDFGAVDVGYAKETDTATVYEVNTAPGITGTTLERYIEQIKSTIEERNQRS